VSSIVTEANHLIASQRMEQNNPFPVAVDTHWVQLRSAKAPTVNSLPVPNLGFIFIFF
jgi:hypothetical protein